MSLDAALPCQLRRDYVLSPITALAFVTVGEEQYLLAAEDTDIKVYHVATSVLRGTLPVFHAQPIHGIYVPRVAGDGGDYPGVPRRTPQVLIWGASAVKVLPGHILEHFISPRNNGGGDAPDRARRRSALFGAVCEAPETIAPDWIFDGRISPFDNNQIVLLTAHNEVIQGRVSPDQKTLELGRIQSPSRPNLYSGNFFWVDPNCLLVAAGTVFGEIVVWKCHLDSAADVKGISRNPAEEGSQEEREKDGCEVLFVFSGHEGSIFGVHISPEIRTSTGETIRLLSSCSDDRTIRIWDITERKDEPRNENNMYDTQISDARQTGFGDSIIGSVGITETPSRCIAMTMGHVSRIWQVEINCLNPLPNGDAIEVYSFGEDGTMQRWHLELNVGGTGASSNSNLTQSKLTHNETFANHSGKQIWSHAMLASTNGLLIATGGGDGKIALLESDSIHTSRARNATASDIARVQELDVSPADLIEKCEDKSKSTNNPEAAYKHGNGKEMFQSFTFITDNRLLITTRSGRIFLGSFNDETEWRELAIPDTIRRTIQSYTILRSARRAATAFIGAPNGELFYYHEASGDSLKSIHKAERKIVDIICLSDTSVPSPGSRQDSRTESFEHIEILVIVYGSSRAELLRLDRTHTLVQRKEVVIPDGVIVTTAAWCHGYLIVGSRSGNLSIFSPSAKDTFTHILDLEVNTGDKVASILPLPRHTENSPRYVITTARDGKYRIYEILGGVSENTLQLPLQLHLLHETSPPFGPLIAESWFFDDDNRQDGGKQDLMLSGFRSKYFVIWNATRQSEVATIECGGGHRVWDQVQMRGNPHGFRFVCTKAAQMKIFSQTRPPHISLKKGGHGREIKAVAAAASARYIATGAEDTAIRLWEMSEAGEGTSEQKFRCSLVLEKHNTGIQRLKWYKDRYLFSSGGNEEFYVWRVSALESDICPLGVLCEATFTDRSEIGDLRITDFDVRCLNEDCGADDRVGTSVEAMDSGEMSFDPEFCISITLSNSTVQSYLYSGKSGFKLLGRRMYTGACLTQLRHLNFIDGYYPQVLAAATDGYLAVFPRIQGCADEAEDDSSNVLVTKLHQSTIKALDMRSIATEAGTSYLVVTGGDDDAIGVMHLRSSRDGSSSSSPLPTSSREYPRYEVKNKIIVRSTHAAAITGIGIVRLENGGRDAVVATASNDQRVKTWRVVDWQSDAPRVWLVDDRYSGVADAGDLEVLGQVRSDGKGVGGRGMRDMDRVLVAGVGIEAWDVL